MDSLKRGLWRVLNPSSRLGKLRRAATETRDGRGDGAPGGRRGRAPLRDVLLNPPLVVGATIVLGLFLLVLLGPTWAPENPYVSARHLVPHYDVQRGEYVSPPLAPSAEYPLGTDRWGNDLLSLLMHGARNTLVACLFVTVTRVAVGVSLGGVAGWNEGKTSDQAVMGMVGVITSVPMLISSMILIYALDIRRGLPVFIVALSATGWTEIAQYVRSEFLVLRKMPYIEGARATGLAGLSIAVRHVLPNVLPQVLVISCLEMGAVMMLLGELGFVGVYIGGGSRISLETDPFTFEFQTLVEIPEWGAMLADGFRWLRSRPFVVFPPALAFFVSVVGFNALGEGLRRLIEANSVNTAFLLRRHMLLAIGGLVLATVLIMNNTGPAPWFAKVAGAFDGGRAYEHVQELVKLEGRGAGQEGGVEAAEYIAEQFRSYGLEPGWKGQSYTYPLETRLVRPVAQPYLALMGPDGTPQHEFAHQRDFGYVTEGHGGSGDVQGPMTFVGFDPASSRLSPESFKGLDLRERIVLLVEGNAPPDFATEALIRGARGVLWIVDNDRGGVRSQLQVRGSDALRRPPLPIYRVRRAAAEALLAPDAYAIEDLINREEGIVQAGVGWFTRDLQAHVRMSLTLGEVQSAQVPCVIGYKPGSDYDLAGQLVVLYAAYDGLGTDPDGTIFSAANERVSGVGILLEMARLWQEQDLDARRSVLFVAWGGSQLADSGAAAYIQHDPNFRHLPATALNKPALLFQFGGLGAGDDVLAIHPQSSPRLIKLVGDAAATVGVPTMSEPGGPLEQVEIVTRKVPWVFFEWSNGQIDAANDGLERIDTDRLQAAGEVMALALAKVVRQATY
jgi:peptide/nickel transport system permease protein